MTFSRKELSADALDRAFARYRARHRTREIAAELGVSVGTLHARLREAGQPLNQPEISARLKGRPRKRAARKPKDGAKDRAASAQEAASTDIAGQAAELEHLCARNMAALRTNLADGGDPDRIARTIAMQTRTLENLRRLRASLEQDAPPHDETPPRSLAELRDELRRHLARISNERRARRIHRRSEGIGGGGASAPLADLLPDGSTPAGV